MLDDLARRYGTDKASTAHFYTRYYERHFAPYRTKPIKLLEIGIQDGYSLKMWKDYFPQGTIHGLDINNCKHFTEDRVVIFQGSQADVGTLREINELAGPFDIIIDDGSHMNADMLLSFETLFPLLPTQGMYVIEDLHACYWKKSHGTGDPVMVDRLKVLIDDICARGKTGIADPAKAHDDTFYRQHLLGDITPEEDQFRALHVYRSIAFIEKA